MEIPLLWSPNWNSRVRRREFLAWISALLVGPAIPRVCRAFEASWPSDVAALAGERPLAIGYLERSDDWDLTQVESWLAGSHIVPAELLAGGDTDLALGLARLTVHGLYPELLPPGVFERLDLSVFFPSPQPDRPEDYLRYFAWSYDESPVLNVGAANRFDVPVGVDGSLAVSLDAAICGAAGSPPGETCSYSLSANFTVDNDPLCPKLRRGAYLFALSGNPWAGERTLPAHGQEPAAELMSLLVTVEEGVFAGDGSGGGPSGDPVPEDSGECGGSDPDLLLVGEDVGSTRTETACRSITAAEYRVRDEGVVTFEAPSITLGDGFEVRGEFEAMNTRAR